MHDPNPQFEALLHGTHGDPFALLGPHGNLVRVLLPGAQAVKLLKPDGTELTTARPTHGGALFEAKLDNPQPYLLSIDWGGTTQVTEDPYSFGLLLSDFDLFLLAESNIAISAPASARNHCTVDGVPGVRFAVWAPNARRGFRRRQFQQLGWAAAMLCATAMPASGKSSSPASL